MSELSVWGPWNVVGVSASGLLLSCSVLLISSLVSDSYLVFTYLVKLMAFLGPLFVTTFLVLLALFTLSPGFVRAGTLGTRPGSIMWVCSTVLNKFWSNADEGTQQQLDAFEGSEVYRIIFEVPDLETGQHGIGFEESVLPPVNKFLIYGDQGVRMLEVSSPSETDGNRPDEGIARPDVESGKKLGALFLEKPCRETESLEGMEVEVKAGAEGEDFNKPVDEEEHDFHNSKTDLPWTKGSEANINTDDNDNVFVRKREGSRRFCGNGVDREIVGGNLGSFRSTRREKEWNRTLACKLVEERHDVEGEGMDSLWETYSVDEQESLSSSSNKGTVIKAKKKKKKVEGEEEGMTEEGLFFCLQALRLSGGEIGRRPLPNLVRIPKPFRRIGLFKHPKKLRV